MKPIKQKIGRSDKLDFPEFGLTDIAVKTDTGAYTSSVHCTFKEEFEKAGKKYLRFKLFDSSFEDLHEETFETCTFKSRSFKSSFGDEEKRYVIETIVVVYGEEVPIELSLSDRSKMKFPILLGRKFLNKRFIVNPTAINLSFNKKTK